MACRLKRQDGPAGGIVNERYAFLVVLQTVPALRDGLPAVLPLRAHNSGVRVLRHVRQEGGSG